MSKLSQMVNNEWTAYSHAPTYIRDVLPTGGTRLKVGLPIGEIGVLMSLILHMKPPLHILYVLHTPRGEGDPGRYQSPGLSVDELDEFLARFSIYLGKDARFDLWLHAPSP
jgi:hypothetical protein